MQVDRISTVTILSAATVTGAGEKHEPNGSKMSFQAVGTTTAGAGATAVKIQASNDGTNYVDLGIISLTLSTSASSDSFSSVVPYKFVRANVNSISGTNAAVTVYMTVEV